MLSRRIACFAVIIGTVRAPAVLAQVGATEANDTIALEVLRPVERTLAGGASHAYRVHLVAGQYVHAVVQQRGVDVVVEVYSPSGAKLLEVDSPNGIEGPEPVDFEAQSAGEFGLVIRALEPNAASGRYEVLVTAVLSPAQRVAEVASMRARRDSVLQWLRETGVRLATVEAGHGFEDMAPIESMVGSARLVALGEATHGTREFFQLKHRMLEFLVSELGFTVFGIEATMPEGFDVNRYVLTGEGDPARALAGLYFWTWDTEEVLAMIRWMREWNANPAHVRRVKFYGFDMQSAPRAAHVVLDYLSRTDAAEAARAKAALAQVANPFTDEGLAALPPGLRQALLDSARALVARFDERRSAYVRRTGEESWAVARQHARIIVQNLSMRLAPDSAFVVRDRSMAENVEWILAHEGPEARMVIWAHNGHVADDAAGPIVWMGRHLRRALGSNMVVFGFAFGRGGFQAMQMPFPSRRGLQAFVVPALPDSTLDGTLVATGMPVAAFDLRALPRDGAVAAWFGAPRGTRSIGAGFADALAPNFVAPQITPQRYDALLWVDSTTRARPNATGPLPPMELRPAAVNLDFEEVGDGGAPAGWLVNDARLATFGYTIAVTSDGPASGARCVEVRGEPRPRYGETYGGLTQLLDATPYRGHRVRLRAMARANVRGTGNEGRLWMQVSRPLVSFTQPPDPRESRQVTAIAWRPYEIVVVVPPTATTLTFGFALVGEGRAWVDNVSVEVLP